MAENKPWYLKDSKIAKALEDFKAATNEKTLLDTKTKELIKVVVSSTNRCHHCTASHIKKALASGVTKDEITEALLLASVQSATNQLNWDKESFERYLGD